MAKKDRAPEGGWLGPPPTEGVPPLGEYRPGKNGKPWKYVEFKLTPKQRKLRKEWERRMAKADAKGKWRFRWPPKD